MNLIGFGVNTFYTSSYNVVQVSLCILVYEKAVEEQRRIIGTTTRIQEIQQVFK